MTRKTKTREREGVALATDSEPALSGNGDQAKREPRSALTFMLGGMPEFQRTVTVGPLDTENRPDAPHDEQVEVILAVDSYEQRLNARFVDAKAKVGEQVPTEYHERHLGDRFYLDLRDLPRLLDGGAVRLPEELEVDTFLDERAAALEAQRAELELERKRRTTELREDIRREALERDAAARAKSAQQAAEAEAAAAEEREAASNS